MSKYYVVLHDGTMDGDCAGDPTTFISIPEWMAIDGMLSEFKELYVKHFMEHIDNDEEYAREEAELLVGGWIVKEETKVIIDDLVSNASIGGDSSLYRFQATLKRILNKSATRWVGQVAR